MRRTALSTFLFVAILGLGCIGVSAPGKADPWTAANIGIQLLAPVLEAVVGTLSGKRSNEGTFKVQETAEHCEDPDSPRYDPSECEPDQIMKANTVDVGSWTTDYRVCFWAVTPDAPPRWKKYWPRFKAEALRRGLSPRDCKKIIFSTAEQTPSPTVTAKKQADLRQLCQRYGRRFIWGGNRYGDVDCSLTPICYNSLKVL